MESEKVGLKLNIQKTKIMASGPITSREIDGETVEIVADLILFTVMYDPPIWNFCVKALFFKAFSSMSDF